VTAGSAIDMTLEEAVNRDVPFPGEFEPIGGVPDRKSFNNPLETQPKSEHTTNQNKNAYQQSR